MLGALFVRHLSYRYNGVPMSEEIETRLKDCSEGCLTTYKDWCGNEKDHSKREALSEALHELRKVCARLEIEMAASEREEQKTAPLPVPPHKASRGANAHDNAGNRGNGGNGGNDAQPPKSKGTGRRPGTRRRSSGN